MVALPVSQITAAALGWCQQQIGEGFIQQPARNLTVIGLLRVAAAAADPQRLILRHPFTSCSDECLHAARLLLAAPAHVVRYGSGGVAGAAHAARCRGVARLPVLVERRVGLDRALLFLGIALGVSSGLVGLFCTFLESKPIQFEMRNPLSVFLLRQIISNNSIKAASP